MCLLIQHIAKCNPQTLSSIGNFKISFVSQRVVSVLYSSNGIYESSIYNVEISVL